jgi:thiosulfate reductase cytochrome b subunit
MSRVYVYPGFERFWHWTQAGLILFLALTGFEIHGSLGFFGFEQAVALHATAAVALMVLIAFAIFWHLTTGEWRKYLPTLENLREHVAYYAVGMFRGAAHPTRESRLGKLNPLQRLVYLGLKLLVFPVVVSSGLLYMFYRYPQRHGIEALDVSGLAAIAVLHTAGAFLLVAFLIAHVYLITTGDTLFSCLKAMITGYEDLEPEPARAFATPLVAVEGPGQRARAADEEEQEVA